MYLAILLVLSASQCRSQPIIERQFSVDSRLYQQYQPSDHNRIKQERHTLHEVPRAQGLYQLQYEPQPESYPEYKTQDVAIPSRDQSSGQPVSHTNLPRVEQYLKEVTPTTKTVYDPRVHKKVESKLVQYTYRSQSEPQEQQVVYTSKTRPQTIPKDDPVAQNILAYHNVVLARQNADYEQQRINQLKKEQQERQQQQDVAPNSEIYISQQIQKLTPAVKKVVKPKPGSLDEELEYYTKLQYDEQQKRLKSESQQVKQTLAPQNKFRISQNPANVAIKEVIAVQPEVRQYTAPTRIATPKQVTKEQLHYQQKFVYRPQIQPETEEIRYYQQQPQELPQLIQYQLQNSPIPNSESQQTYTTKFVRYEAVQPEPNAGTKHQYEIQHNPEPQYVQAQPQEVLQGQQQHPQGANAGPSDEEYKQSQFRKSLGRNSSLRVLKTGKSVVFIGNDE